MTYAEARASFGIKENETINQAGVKYLIECEEELLATGLLNKHDRAEIRKTIEALKALLQERM